MKLNGKIHQLPKTAKIFIFCFVLTLSFGFYTGLLFVNENTSTTSKGIETHYLGNENDENATEMQFKQSKKEIITTIHNHVTSFSLIFFALGSILLLTSINSKVKKVLIIEPFISIILTFGGIWLLWSGVLWFKYIIMFSGIMLTLNFTVSVAVVFSQLLKGS